MKPEYQLKIVCGLHRSGTTYVGNILSRNSSMAVVHEPCNPDWGVKGIKIWYPFFEATELPDKDTTELFEKILSFQCGWNHQPPRKLKWNSHLFYKLCGGWQGLIWKQLRTQKFFNSLPPNICWKDPFVTFALGHLLSTYDAQAVCMVRHPGALWYSNRKLDWPFDIQRLTRQNQLIEKYGADIPAKYWKSATSNSPASIAILWKIMARLISSQAKSNPSLIAIRHEDLCTQTLNITEKICNHLNIPLEDKMTQFIKETTSGKETEASKGVVHSFNRDSKKIINSWRNKLPEEEEIFIQEIIGEDFERFYSNW